MIITEFGDFIAERMRAEHRTLATRWFERLLDLLPVDARSVFPTDRLLDHIPRLIVEIADALRETSCGSLTANTTILEKARELGALRHAQRASLHQVLREYQILGSVLVAFVSEELERQSIVPPPVETVRVVSMLHHAVSILSQATVESFVTLYTETITEQSERLEQFTRMVAHEWRQPLGALQFGVSLLRRSDLGSERTARTLDSVERNVSHLVELTHKVEALARTQRSGDNPVIQDVSARTIAEEAARQLRDMSDARGVAVRIDDGLPTITVDVGRLELVLVNLLSNAIKYADPEKPGRYVDVRWATGSPEWCGIEVCDNGIGIPSEALSGIFKRFTRAHADRDGVLQTSGIGLGLAIVDDCVRAMGGRIEVESAEREGTTFRVMLPMRPPEH